MLTHSAALKRAQGNAELMAAGWTPDAKAVLGGYAPIWGIGVFRLEYDALRKAYVCYFTSDTIGLDNCQGSSHKEHYDAIESLRIRLALRRNALQETIDAIRTIQGVPC